LGIHFFKNGHTNRTQKRLAQHGAYALHNLFIVFNQIELNIKDKCKLFDSLVGSVLNYSAELLGINECKYIELLHCKFLRKILVVKKCTNLSGLYGETGRYPMYISRKIIMFKYWLNFLSSNENSLVKLMYKKLKEDADNNITYKGLNWANAIKNYLSEMGLNYLWINQWDIEINFDTIKTRILDNFKQSWYADINNSNRLLSYCIYKHDFEYENYLDKINDNKLRITLTQFRLSSHSLAIETGRYDNIPREERKCKLCNMNTVETEYHFLLVCPKYSSLRKKYFKQYFCRWPTVQKFETIMNIENGKQLQNLAKFLYHAFILREAHL
jgi:hypothetical protein